MQSTRLGMAQRPCSIQRPAGVQSRQLVNRPVKFSVAPMLPRRSGVVVMAGAGLAHPGEESQREDNCPSYRFNPVMGVPDVTMAKGGGDMGSSGSLGATMERSRMQFVMPTPVVQGPKLDDGGSGGDIGKHNHNGGGGGDGGGDDDDYSYGDDDGEGGDGEGQGDGFMRTIIPESYDKFSIAAVFAEWMRTVADLPLIIRRAVEMGLFSSAQLVRFFSMDCRPSVARSVTRNLPPTWAREFVGRLMADPAFAQKLVLESAMAGSASLYYEYRMRGDKFKQELDLATINSVGMAAATAATVWLLAPSRSYGSVHKFPWQQMLDNLPNCVFDTSGPLRQYTKQMRIGSFFAKMAELSAVGAVTGTVTSLASSGAIQLRKSMDPSFEPSTSVPSLGRSSGGLATYFATSANIRYQLIGGLDRYLFSHSNFLWTYLGITCVTRLASMSVGELSRPWWQGLPEAGHNSRQVRTRRVSKKVSKRVPKLAAAPAAVSVSEASAVAVAAAVVVAGEEGGVSRAMEVVPLADGAVSIASVSPVAADSMQHASSAVSQHVSALSAPSIEQHDVAAVSAQPAALSADLVTPSPSPVEVEQQSRPASSQLV